MNSMIFRNLAEPKIENVYQIQLYLHYFNIKQGILFYVDKDKQDIKEFLIKYNQPLVQQLLSTFKNLKEKIDSNIVPPRLVEYPGNWRCQYCQFKDVCSMADGGEMNWEDFKKKIESQNKEV